MLELSALGLLQRQPLHGYRLKQQLELFMSSYISVNYGAIYPLLKRLEERGEISVMAQVAGDGGNPRKIYDITAQGRELWREQMLEHHLESQQPEHDDRVDSYQAASWERCTSTLQLEIEWLTEQLAQEQGAIAVRGDCLDSRSFYERRSPGTSAP